MKKKSLLALSLALMVVFIAACTNTTNPSVENSVTPSESSVVPSENNPASENTSMSPTAPTETSALKLGLGVVSTTSNSTAAGQNTLGNAKNMTVVCAVAVDENDVIRNVKFDTVDSALEFDAKGMFTTDVNSPVKTLKEMKYDYGLSKTSENSKEWFEQIGSFEKWATGKSIDDVMNMKLNEKNVPTAEDLKTTVNIGVSDQLAALRKAYDDAKA